MCSVLVLAFWLVLEYIAQTLYCIGLFLVWEFLYDHFQKQSRMGSQTDQKVLQLDCTRGIYSLPGMREHT